MIHHLIGRLFPGTRLRRPLAPTRLRGRFRIVTEFPQIPDAERGNRTKNLKKTRLAACSREQKSCAYGINRMNAAGKQTAQIARRIEDARVCHSMFDGCEAIREMVG